MAGDEDLENVTERPHVLIVGSAARCHVFVRQFGNQPESVGLPAEADRARTEAFLWALPPSLAQTPGRSAEGSFCLVKVAARDRAAERWNSHRVDWPDDGGAGDRSSFWGVH